ncbi:MAG: phasin family protein [Rhodospirillales bacterium]|nr:phasin family protein [Rhodospirillales bacterium]
MNAPSRKMPAPKSPAMIESAYNAAKEAVETVFGPSTVTKNFENAFAFGQANADAAVAAGNALLAGAQEIGQVWLALAQETVDDGVSALRRLTACRSTPELIAAQGEIARTSYAKYASKSRALTDLAAKLAENVSAPVVARADAALTVLTKPIAA